MELYKEGGVRISRVIDAKGLACPQPVIKAREALKDMTA